MSRKKHVLMVSPHYKPAIGGVEVHVERIVDVLTQQGIDITILTSSHDLGLKPCENIGFVRVLRIPYGWERNPFLVFFWMFRSLRKLERYDIVHVHDTIPLLFWYLPQLFLHPMKQVYTTFHGFERDPVPWFFKILRRIARRLSYRAICIGSFIECVYQVRCDTVLIGAVETIDMQNESQDGLVFVGRVESDSGVIQYVDVLKSLELNHGIKTHLTVCGGGTLESDLVERAENIGVDLRMKGVVDKPSIFVASAQACLAGGYLSILEAMSQGVPVVALAQTELKWRYYLSMKESGGPISIQTTTEGVAREITRLLTNPSLYHAISGRSRDFASTLTWERMALEYLSLWSS